MQEQIQTLFIDRALSPLSLDPHFPTTGLISRWIAENDQPALPRPLKKLMIRLAAPSVTLDERTNRLLVIQDQTYWNTNLLGHNIRTLRRLLCSVTGRPAGLETLDIKLEGQFENTLLAANEIWSFVTTHWARTVVDYRVRLFPFIFCHLYCYETLEADFYC